MILFSREKYHQRVASEAKSWLDFMLHSRKVSDAALAKLFWSFSHKIAQNFVMLAFLNTK